MSTDIKLNALLSLPEQFSEELKPGATYTIEKEGYRIMPVQIPMELSTHDHKYLGKVIVTELRITGETTQVTFKVLKLFTAEEAKVYSENFVSKPS